MQTSKLIQISASFHVPKMIGQMRPQLVWLKKLSLKDVLINKYQLYFGFLSCSELVYDRLVARLANILIIWLKLDIE